MPDWSSRPSNQEGTCGGAQIFLYWNYQPQHVEVGLVHFKPFINRVEAWGRVSIYAVHFYRFFQVSLRPIRTNENKMLVVSNVAAEWIWRDQSCMFGGCKRWMELMLNSLPSAAIITVWHTLCLLVNQTCNEGLSCTGKTEKWCFVFGKGKKTTSLCWRWPCVILFGNHGHRLDHVTPSNNMWLFSCLVWEYSI